MGVQKVDWKSRVLVSIIVAHASVSRAVETTVDNAAVAVGVAGPALPTRRCDLLPHRRKLPLLNLQRYPERAHVQRLNSILLHSHVKVFFVPRMHFSCRMSHCVVYVLEMGWLFGLV